MFEFVLVLIKIQGRVQKKKLEFSNFVGDPPSPLKLENIQLFFYYMTCSAIFFIKFFAYSCHETYNIKRSPFSKKILYCVGVGTPRSLATQPTLGGGLGVSLKQDRTLFQIMMYIKIAIYRQASMNIRIDVGQQQNWWGGGDIRPKKFYYISR